MSPYDEPTYEEMRMMYILTDEGLVKKPKVRKGQNDYDYDRDQELDYQQPYGEW